MVWTIGVDVGGTFTDFYAYESESGRVALGKRASTPDDPAHAVLDGLRDLVSRHGIPLARVARLSHGTTVGTNALIQRRGGRLALVTTQGFRDLLEIGRQTRPHMFDLHRDYPPPLVPRERRLEIRERIGADGDVQVPLDEAALADAAAAVAQADVDACAVCLLFSFLNSAHEQAVAEALRRAAPQLYLSLSCEVQPEFREYERFSTTVLNAYLQPVMTRYLSNLESGLSALAANARVGINQSSGGLMSPERARRFPIRTALSGPAAGAVGAVHVAHAAEIPNVITLDMGGTSADVALIEDYRHGVSFNRDVAGFPIRQPIVDIETVGAGGGSIAWFDLDGLLKVGPESAGADPGPACYARGGERPTVTDANLVLERLSPEGLLDGRMALDMARARGAFTPLAERVGFSLERTAHGVLGIVVANMVRAIRTISVERGYDPRAFALMPFGGAGPLHAREVAVSLGIRRILVPPAPGIVCAEGLVVSENKEDLVASLRTPVEDDNRDLMRAQVRALFEQARRWFEDEAVAPEHRTLELRLDVRYVGQNFELPVPLGSGHDLGPECVPDAAELRARFFQAHDAAYGYFNAEDPIEVMNYRLTAGGRIHRIAPAIAGAASPEPGPCGVRAVYFEADRALESRVYRRADLAPGHRLAGPAVIEQLDTTTLLYPGDDALVDGAGNLIIEVTA